MQQKINELWDRSVDIIQFEEKKNNEENEQSIRELRDNTRIAKICIVGVPEEERKGSKGNEEIMAETSQIDEKH